MIDLLGFWGNVSLITLLLLAPVASIVLLLFHIFVNQVVQDDTIAYKITRPIYDDSGCYIILFGRIKLPAFLSGSLVIFGVLSWPIVAGTGCSEDLTLVAAVSKISELLAGVTGWIWMIVGSYLAALWVCRKLWAIYLKINSALSKLEKKDV
jgi:hypothetical protein